MGLWLYYACLEKLSSTDCVTLNLYILHLLYIITELSTIYGKMGIFTCKWRIDNTISRQRKLMESMDRGRNRHKYKHTSGLHVLLAEPVAFLVPMQVVFAFF